MLNHLGIRWHLTKHAISIHASGEDAVDSQGLTGWLSDVLGYPILDLAVYAGSNSPRRKITALAIAEGGNPDVIVKIADTELGADAIRQEAEALQAIAESSLAGHAPRLIAQGSWNRYVVQIQEAISGDGRAQMPHLTGVHFEFLAGLSRLDRTRIPCRETRIWRDLKLRTAGMPLQPASSTARLALDRVFSPTFADLPVTCHRTHGDFAPWNIKLHRGRLLAYDWADSQSAGLALSDLFHFLFRQASLVGPWRGAQSLLRSMMRSASTLVGMAALPETHIRPALLLWALQEYVKQSSSHMEEVVGRIVGVQNWLRD